MNKKIFKIGGGLAGMVMVSLTLIFTFTLPTRAENQTGQTQGETESEAKETSSNISCPDEILKTLLEEDQEFLDFMDTHLQNEALASELFETAIQRYDLYKNNIQEKLDELSEFQKGELIEQEAEEYRNCLALVEEHKQAIRETLDTQIIGNAQTKKTNTLLRKYQDLNKKLEELNRAFGQLQGYFTKLGEIPAYSDCKGVSS